MLDGRLYISVATFLGKGKNKWGQWTNRKQMFILPVRYLEQEMDFP
jgi:hypothetical protein